MTHLRSGSVKSRSWTGTKHDGPVDGNLNIIALNVYVIHINLFTARRHYSLLQTARLVSYIHHRPRRNSKIRLALEDILELHTYRLRPPDSNQWAKIRSWKPDTSFVSLLLNVVLDGAVLRIYVRDGHERPANDTVAGLGVL